MDRARRGFPRTIIQKIVGQCFFGMDDIAGIPTNLSHVVGHATRRDESRVFHPCRLACHLPPNSSTSINLRSRFLNRPPPWNSAVLVIVTGTTDIGLIFKLKVDIVFKLRRVRICQPSCLQGIRQHNLVARRRNPMIAYSRFLNSGLWLLNT